MPGTAVAQLNATTDQHHTGNALPVLIGHELTPHNRQALFRGEMDAVINQNVGHLVRSALRVLRAYSDRSAIDATQERIRIEIILKENLADDSQASLPTRNTGYKISS